MLSFISFQLWVVGWVVAITMGVNIINQSMYLVIFHLNIVSGFRMEFEIIYYKKKIVKIINNTVHIIYVMKHC